MKVPGLGEVTEDEELGRYFSRPFPVPMFGGKACRVVLDGDVEDEREEAVHAAINNSLGHSPDILREVDSLEGVIYRGADGSWPNPYQDAAADAVRAARGLGVKDCCPTAVSTARVDPILGSFGNAGAPFWDQGVEDCSHH